jgi:hypothetical protein
VIGGQNFAGAMFDSFKIAPFLWLMDRKIEVKFRLPYFAYFFVLHKEKDALNFVSRFQIKVQKRRIQQ